MTPKSVPKDKFISGVAPLGAPLVAQTVFGHQKLVPSAAQVLPIIEKSTKKTPKSPPIAKNSSRIQGVSEPGPVDCAKRLNNRGGARAPADGMWRPPYTRPRLSNFHLPPDAFPLMQRCHAPTQSNLGI